MRLSSPLTSSHIPAPGTTFAETLRRSVLATLFSINTSRRSGLVRLQLVDFYFYGTAFFVILVADAAHVFDFFELFALRSFECEVTLEARTTRHSTPAAVAKQRYSTNPERVPACNRRPSKSWKPSASFLPASVDAKRHLVNTKPRSPVAEFCPPRPRCRRSNHVCVPEATGVGYHNGNSHCAFLTQSPRLPLARRKRPRRQDGIMTSAKQLGWQNGFNRVLLNTSFNIKVPHARCEDEWS